MTRYISVGSLAGTIALAGVTAAADGPVVVPLGAAASAAVIIHRHRANCRGLWAGTERRVGQRVADLSKLTNLRLRKR